MKRLLAIGAVVVVVGSVLIASLSGSDQGLAVEVAPAERGALSRVVKATGTVAPAQQVVVSTKVGGEIVELPVVEGQKVEKGDLLARIEPQAYRAARDQARAALAQARAAVVRADAQAADARRVLSRSQALQAEGHVSGETLEQARLQVNVAEAERQVARHAASQQRFAVERAEEDLGRTTIRSPLTGEIIRLEVEQGESVVPGTLGMPGSVLLTVADLGTLVAEVEVNEVDVVEVALGQPVDVRVEALGDTVLPGEVRHISVSGVEDPTLGVVRFPVEVALTEPDPRLRPGMTAQVEIHTATHEDVVRVPIQAVVRRGADGGEDGREVVYRVQDGTARETPVVTGIADALQVEVVEGLEAGDEVVVGPYRALRQLEDELPVTPREPESAEAEEGEDRA